VGGLRGWKGTIYEGGLRVPALIEWPAVIKTPRVTSYPACTMDIFPTLAEIVGLPETAGLQPQDGLSLLPLFQKELGSRPKPIPFRHTGRAAWIDNDDKLLIEGLGKGDYQLYNLETDPGETRDLSSERPQRFEQMKMAFEAWNRSVEASVAGKDYPEGQVDPAERGPGSWVSEPGYAPYLREWALRPEYRAQLKRFRESPQSMEPE
jgi:arylsulfatase A-like enzyme